MAVPSFWTDQQFLLFVRVKKLSKSIYLQTLSFKLLRADVALQQAKLQPVVLGLKEGLAIVNGTATSAGVAALALHEIMNLAALSQPTLEFRHVKRPVPQFSHFPTGCDPVTRRVPLWRPFTPLMRSRNTSLSHLAPECIAVSEPPRLQSWCTSVTRRVPSPVKILFLLPLHSTFYLAPCTFCRL